MRDKRPVDELSIAELERILAIRKREARMQQRQRMERDGRVVQPKPSGRSMVSASAPITSPPPIDDQALPASPTPPSPIVIDTRAKPPDAPPQFEDDDALSTQTAKDERLPKRQQRQLIDRLLVVIEVAAVIGIVFIGIHLLGAINLLERETQEAQQIAEEQRRLGIPTIEPTPTIRVENIVLPTGHIYSEDQIVEFNINEIPAHLRPVVQSQILQPVLSRPEPTEETALRLVIPKIDVDAVIVPGTDLGALRLGVGQLMNGVDPGDREGNLVLAAHNDIYGQLFRYLDQLAPGDVFTVHTQVQAHDYVVADIEIVEPNDVWVMDNQPGRTMATLISCYPYQQNYQRIIVFADRIN